MGCKASDMNGLEFDGLTYHDDRMYVLYVSPCTVKADEETISTTIYHENIPGTHKWCVVTYRNVERYTGVRVDHFETESEAIAYKQSVEPTVPLISLGGCSPETPLPFDQFLKWKESNGFKEYNYKEMYAAGGNNHQETFHQAR